MTITSYNRLVAHENPEYLTSRFLLGIGVGAEYPCGSVAASEQSEEEAVAKNAQNRWFALATSMSHLLIVLPSTTTNTKPRPSQTP